jgi:hypothetical protein
MREKKRREIKVIVELVEGDKYFFLFYFKRSTISPSEIYNPFKSNNILLTNEKQNAQVWKITIYLVMTYSNECLMT